jgi:hypothetical protein
MRKRNRAGETIFELQPVTMTDSNRSASRRRPNPGSCVSNRQIP